MGSEPSEPRSESVTPPEPRDAAESVAALPPIEDFWIPHRNTKEPKLGPRAGTVFLAGAVSPLGAGLIIDSQVHKAVWNDWHDEYERDLHRADEQRDEHRAESAERPSQPPAPKDKPDPRAQWDEARGEWIVWNPEANGWETVG